ncbi:hypothetical protein BaRGS_00037215 [Batillaria attramentaria]|uniref:Uncharacterized protein n=1 Tax=Batillaria attramentaria TaxID=370345 RepID=A0ABD0J995_9CAEN
MTEEKTKEKSERHKRPANCDLTVAKVNPEIWSLMDHPAKRADLRRQNEQKLLMTAASALTEVSNLMKTVVAENKESLRSAMDSMALIMKASHEISMDRRNKILNAPFMNKKYRNWPPQKHHLFGDDLKASLAAIDSATKLGQTFQNFQNFRGKKFSQYAFSKNGDWRENQSQRGQGKNGAWQRGRAMRMRGPFNRNRGGWHQKPLQQKL